MVQRERRAPAGTCEAQKAPIECALHQDSSDKAAINCGEREIEAFARVLRSLDRESGSDEERDHVEPGQCAGQ
jgi:hypothetical protein